jgi:hypothetical protein
MFAYCHKKTDLLVGLELHILRFLSFSSLYAMQTAPNYLGLKTGHPEGKPCFCYLIVLYLYTCLNLGSRITGGYTTKFEYNLIRRIP